MMHAATPRHAGELAWGTVGWGDDTDQTYVDFDDGSGADSETGITLVRVTLFRGRTPIDPIDNTRAQGWRILCQLGSPDMMVPPRNTRVVVALPEPHGQHPGNGVILQAVDSRGKLAYGSVQPGERSIMALAGFGQVFFKEDGTLILKTQQGNQSGGGDVPIACNPDGTVSLGALTPSDFAALANLVNSNFNTLVTAINAHVHTAPSGGGATSGGQSTPPTPYFGPTPPMVPIPGSVASSKVKVQP